MLTFEAIEQLEPGPRWAELFEAHWPRYRAWFLQEGEAARTVVRRLAARAAGAHARARAGVRARRASSQEAATSRRASSQCGRRRPISPAARRRSGRGDGARCSRATTTTRPSGSRARSFTRAWVRPVIGIGRLRVGPARRDERCRPRGLARVRRQEGRRRGFGVPIVVRYLLETCETTEQARATLPAAAVPPRAHPDDRRSRGRRLHGVPRARSRVELTTAVAATNHQGSVEWHEHAPATRSVERQRMLERLVSDAGSADGFVEGFLEPPLFATDGDRRLGTLYTVAYHVGEGRAEFRWPELSWDQSFGGFPRACDSRARRRARRR